MDQTYTEFFSEDTIRTAESNSWFPAKTGSVVGVWLPWGDNDNRVELCYNATKEIISNGSNFGIMNHVPMKTWNYMICLEAQYRRMGKFSVGVFKEFFDKYCELAYANHRPRIPYSEYRTLKKISQYSADKQFYYINKTETSFLLIGDDFETHYEIVNVPKEFIDDLVKQCAWPVHYIDAAKGPFFNQKVTEKVDNFLAKVDRDKDKASREYEFKPMCIDEPKQRLVAVPEPNWVTSIKNNKKENKATMKAPAINFEFGPITDNSVVMSPCGLAIAKGDGSYVAFNPATSQMVDVTGLTFDFGKIVYKVPVAVKDIKIGDLIYHNKKPVYVIGITNGITAIDYTVSEQKTIVPISNLFGFNYVTKVMPLINFNATTPDPANPFGNIMPMLFMSSILNGEDGDTDGLFSGDLGKLAMMSMFMGGQNPFANMFAAPAGNASSTDQNANPQFTIPGFNMGN